jgi:hypothetical protein
VGYSVLNDVKKVEVVPMNLPVDRTPSRDLISGFPISQRRAANSIGTSSKRVESTAGWSK